MNQWALLRSRLTPAFSGAVNGIERTCKNRPSRPPLQRLVRRPFPFSTFPHSTRGCTFARNIFSFQTKAFTFQRKAFSFLWNALLFQRNVSSFFRNTFSFLWNAFSLLWKVRPFQSNERTSL